MKGVVSGILGLFAFLAGLNAVNATFLWTQLGSETMVQPYLIGSLTGELSIATYLWISIFAAFVFLGLTLSNLVGKIPNPAVLANVVEKVNDLQNDEEVLGKIRTRLMIIDASLSDIGKGFPEGFGELGEDMKEIHGGLFTKFDKEIADFKQQMTKQLGKMEKAVQKAEWTYNENETVIKEQIKEIANIKLKIERLEEELAKPRPRLTSRSDLKKVKGIGTLLANELRGIGMKNVSNLILTDPLIIVEKTGISRRTVERLQGRARLLMVPGINEKDITLLEEVGITTRRDLADQDPIELGKKMNGISEVERPTIEEIDSWIKFARS